MSSFQWGLTPDDMNFWGKLRQISWGQVLLVCMLACTGFTCLYSAAGGDLDKWASPQIMRFLFALGMMIAIAMTNLRWIYRLAWPFYGMTIILLIFVDVFGHIGMGAQRWLNLGIIKIQPSELAKIATVLALARFYHTRDLVEVRRLKNILFSCAIIAVPFVLVVAQPDLGTAMAISFAGIAMLFVAGVSIWIFIAGAVGVAALIPIAWQFMHDYQQKRVLIFMDPESDPLGAGFHITQSKIALGSGGVSGKGFMQGTQSHLNFLPEKHTDFIFTLFAEEWGLMGGLALLTILGFIILYGYWIAFRCRNQFARLVAFGLTFNFSVYVIVNIGMVMGLLPVVGIPLPLMSYGGTAMLTVMAAFGIIQSCSVHRDIRISKGLLG
ncbi:MAG: rod shape-determining protein RodA [Pseudobdellovibrionaceae bacterium]